MGNKAVKREYSIEKREIEKTTFYYPGTGHDIGNYHYDAVVVYSDSISIGNAVFLSDVMERFYRTDHKAKCDAGLCYKYLVFADCSGYQLYLWYNSCMGVGTI